MKSGQAFKDTSASSNIIVNDSLIKRENDPKLPLQSW